jgi:hypothetical protein
MARTTEGSPNALTGGLDLPFAPRNPGIPLELAKVDLGRGDEA